MATAPFVKVALIVSVLAYRILLNLLVKCWSILGSHFHKPLRIEVKLNAPDIFNQLQQLHTPCMVTVKCVTDALTVCDSPAVHNLSSSCWQILRSLGDTHFLSETKTKRTTKYRQPLTVNDQHLAWHSTVDHSCTDCQRFGPQICSNRVCQMLISSTTCDNCTPGAWP